MTAGTKLASRHAATDGGSTFIDTHAGCRGVYSSSGATRPARRVETRMMSPSKERWKFPTFAASERVLRLCAAQRGSLARARARLARRDHSLCQTLDSPVDTKPKLNLEAHLSSTYSITAKTRAQNVQASAAVTYCTLARWHGGTRFDVPYTSTLPPTTRANGQLRAEPRINQEASRAIEPKIEAGAADVRARGHAPSCLSRHSSAAASRHRRRRAQHTRASRSGQDACSCAARARGRSTAAHGDYQAL